MELYRLVVEPPFCRVRLSVVVSHDSSSTSISLLRRVRLRDGEAWERFCALYSPIIYTWCRRLGLQDSDAANTVQNVFRVVFQGIGEFRGDGGAQPGVQRGSFRGWLWTITRNQVHSHFRKQGNLPQAVGGSSFQQRIAEIPSS